MLRFLLNDYFCYLMVIKFGFSLKSALEEINIELKREFIIYPLEKVRDYSSSDEFLEKYADAKVKIVTTLNSKYGTSFDLENWLKFDKEDEVAYFINESGSNTLSYSEFKAPFRFLLFFGSKGFVIGLEQKGKGFDAHKVDRERLKDNKGAAFDFYRNCEGSVFFDDASDARIVYYMKIFK